jgi:hypothetical protein
MANKYIVKKDTFNSHMIGTSQILQTIQLFKFQRKKHLKILLNIFKCQQSEEAQLSRIKINE